MNSVVEMARKLTHSVKFKLEQQKILSILNFTTNSCIASVFNYSNDSSSTKTRLEVVASEYLYSILHIYIYLHTLPTYLYKHVHTVADCLAVLESFLKPYRLLIHRLQ